MDGNKMNINWYPGHMAKTKRVIKECLPQVDIVLELIDARIPYSSKNPEIEKLAEEAENAVIEEIPEGEDGASEEKESGTGDWSRLVCMGEVSHVGRTSAPSCCDLQ